MYIQMLVTDVTTGEEIEIKSTMTEQREGALTSTPYDRENETFKWESEEMTKDELHMARWR